MKGNIITGVLVLILVGFCANVFNKNIQQQFDKQYVYTKYINTSLEEVKRDLIIIRSKKSDSDDLISRLEFDDARDSIESNKKFIEYEVKMSRKSIKEFVDNLNRDMQHITNTVNRNEQNYKDIQGKLEFIMEEINSIQEIPEEVREDAPTLPWDASSVIESEVIPIVQTAAVKEIEVEDTPIIEDIVKKKKCTMVFDPKTKKEQRISANRLQRAVNRDNKKGAYNISAYFNINDMGKAIDIDIKSDNSPSNFLKKAVQNYVSRLNFISDKGYSNCELNFNLNVV
jgi:archaellum component FlaC